MCVCMHVLYNSLVSKRNLREISKFSIVISKRDNKVEILIQRKPITVHLR